MRVVAGDHRGRARRRRAPPSPQKDASAYPITATEPAQWQRPRSRQREVAGSKPRRREAHPFFHFYSALTCGPHWSVTVAASSTRARPVSACVAHGPARQWHGVASAPVRNHPIQIQIWIPAHGTHPSVALGNPGLSKKSSRPIFPVNKRKARNRVKLVKFISFQIIVQIL